MATVTFNSQGGSAVTSQTVTVGTVATDPTDPFYADYVFGEWFTEYTCVNQWSFATVVPGDMTLYAKWVEIVIVPIEVKTLLGITGTAKDALIGMLIPMVQNGIIEYCRNTFEDADGNVVWPEGIKIPAARMIAEQMAEMSGGGASIGMESETQGGYSYSRGGNSASAKGQSGYSLRTEGLLNNWKLVGALFAQKLQQYRDRRGIPLENLAEGKAIPGFEGVPLGSTVYPRRWVAV